MTDSNRPASGHPSLFGGISPEPLPELVAPRVTAPRVEGPKAQPLALDLFAEVGLFAEDTDEVEVVEAPVEDGLVTVQRAERSPGYLIPAPVDPGERAAFEQGVAAREAAGLSPFVGEDYLDAPTVELPAMRDNALVETARAMFLDVAEKRTDVRRDIAPTAEVQLVAGLQAALAEEAPGVNAAFRLLAEAATALDARNPNTLDDIAIDLTWREHQDAPTRDVDWLLLGLVEGRPNSRVSA